MLTSNAILISIFSTVFWLMLTRWLWKSKKLTAPAAILLFLLPILAGNIGYYRWMAPQRQQEAAIDYARTQLASLPVWRTIKVQQPALYQQASDELIGYLRKGMPLRQAVELLRPLAADLLNQRINTARDKDLIAYMQISLEEMKQIRQLSPGQCFRFLFPQVKGGVNIAELLPQDLIARDLVAMDSLLQHSNGAAPPDDLSRGRQQLQKVVQGLYNRWGSDLQTLNTPGEPGADETKLCDMTIDLYQSVLALTDKDSANVLRIIIGGTDN
ncbi:hypothetical protein EPIR_2545 [Erwinia piriflorinigrans CFBP 5888]|uniref:Uncharacterized protein n=1 Tax=Erwinia piriflorinigrans CFBP 5888 TaxID=1161919 RepID=V5ZAD0_9GAMM|nr:hypothetical protein [Erwinia piriflorinigrans]CCG87908.1 hypothetical protein EPIR_2545 [Erwinia piriflorinigrans CFBP 5888]